MNSGSRLEKMTVAAGCFWGVEHLYRKHFEGKGIASDGFRVGYTGGHTKSPSYRQVCSEQTGHAEALQVDFDPQKVSYEELVRFFFRMHDPTTLNAQGPDHGSSYRSGIFYHTPDQRQIAERVRDDVQRKRYPSRTVVTEIVPFERFWDAEDYHQKYLILNPSGYECPSHYLRTWADE